MCRLHFCYSDGFLQRDKTLFGEMHHDIPRQAYWRCRVMITHKICLSIIELVCDLGSHAQFSYEGELVASLFATFRCLSLTDLCLGRLSKDSQGTWSFQWGKYHRFVKMKGMLFLSCLGYLPSLAYLPPLAYARTENFLFHIFLTLKKNFLPVFFSVVVSLFSILTPVLIFPF